MPRVEDAVWTATALALTVTAVVVAPSVRCTSRLVVVATVTSILVSSNVLNPVATTVSLYIPGVNPRKAKSPVGVTLLSSLIPVAIFSSVTFALTTTAPEGSVSLPTIAPVLI